MMRADHRHHVALALIGPLIANTTSAFNAIVALLVLTPIVLLLASLPLQNRSVAQRIVISALVGASFGGLLMLGINHFAPAPWANDVVEAYGATVLLAALAATGLKAISPPPLSPTHLAGLLLAIGAFCEVLGYGVLLGDHEIAFAGATSVWRIQLLDLAPVPPAASPAGALCIAALMYGVMQTRNARKLDTETPTTTITEPRSGRRVRVTGHIS